MAEIILFVEDSPDDQLLFEHALQALPFAVTLRFANEGEEAIAYLKREGRFSDQEKSPVPSVIFLDIKMPGKSGFEVLRWLKHDAPNAIHRIPVVMFSSSNEQVDIDRAYDLGANAYLVKPGGYEALRALFKTSGEFFVEHVERPSVN
jgi:CheY-like chemotaxis protein